MTSSATSPFAGRFIVADMDGTLTSTPSKAHGHYLPLSSSPCLQPLQRFLVGGGDLCVVSTAGRRMWRQIYEVLQPTLFSSPKCGRLFLCGFSGAALFVSNFKTKSMEEDVRYRETALNGSTTVLPPNNLANIHDIARSAVLRSYQRMLDEPNYLKALSKKYHEPLQSLLEEVKKSGLTLDESPLLTLEAMQDHGRYLKETKDALLDVQVVPNADGTIEVSAPAAQITALAIPMKHAHEIFTHDVLDALSTLGVKAKFQPNSVVIARGGLDKGSCVRYLMSSYGLDLTRAVAFGDIPQSIDRPLTEFPPMPFVSVSLTLDQDPPGLVAVGGEEEGTAAFLNAWLPNGEDVIGIDENVERLNDAKFIQRAAETAQQAWRTAASLTPPSSL